VGEARHWYLLHYDVTDPARWRSVYKKLRAWGKHMQFSAFRVRASEREFERLRYELAKILTREDRLMTVRLCTGCVERVTVQGPPLEPWEPDPPLFRFM
jgi:CRISPR-associated protein Cas2